VKYGSHTTIIAHEKQMARFKFYQRFSPVFLLVKDVMAVPKIEERKITPGVHAAKDNDGH